MNAYYIMKKNCIILSCLAIFGGLYSCSESSILETDNTNYNILPSLVGHEIKFYYDYEGTLYRSVFITPQDNQSLNAMAFSAKQMLDGHTYQYSPNGNNTAYLSMNLYYYAAADTYDLNGVEKIYHLTLTFVTPTQGYATGKMVQEMVVYGKLEKVRSELNWYFCIDSSTLPDKVLIDKTYWLN